MDRSASPAATRRRQLPALPATRWAMPAAARTRAHSSTARRPGAARSVCCSSLIGLPPRLSGILRRMPPTPRRIEPGPGQESVWDYPRPPRVERCGRRLRVVFNGCVVAETTRALRVLETSQPPAYYFPPEDVRLAPARAPDPALARPPAAHAAPLDAPLPPPEHPGADEPRGVRARARGHDGALRPREHRDQAPRRPRQLRRAALPGTPLHGGAARRVRGRARPRGPEP